MKKKKKEEKKAGALAPRPERKPDPKYKGIIRTENIKPYTLFEMDWKPSKEIHFSLPNTSRVNSSIATIMLMKDGKELCEMCTIQKNVDWDYDIVLLKDKCLKIEAEDGEVKYKIFKKRSSKSDGEASSATANQT